MSNNCNLSLLAALASVAFSFLNELLLAVVVLVLVFWFLKDEEITAKVLTPLLIVLSVRLFQAVMTLIAKSLGQIVAFFKKYNDVEYHIVRIINPIANTWLVVFLILFIVFLFLKKETPLYGKFSKLFATNAHQPLKKDKPKSTKDDDNEKEEL